MSSISLSSKGFAFVMSRGGLLIIVNLGATSVVFIVVIDDEASSKRETRYR